MTVQAVSNLEDKSFSLENPGGKFPALIICEHASNYIPQCYNGLGLDEDVRVSHVAWDPGADAVAANLCTMFDATYVKGEISRLVYDCNRPPEAVDAMPATSEIFEIPGNRNLGEAERAARIAAVYTPFSECLDEVLRSSSHIRALVTIHSFTPVYRGQQRTVELGILHDSDTRLADVMLENAGRFTALNVQRNEPYGPQHGVTHTLKLHGISNGLHNVMIEIRNDLLKTRADCEKVSKELYEMLLDAFSSLGISQTKADTP